MSKIIRFIRSSWPLRRSAPGSPGIRSVRRICTSSSSLNSFVGLTRGNQHCPIYAIHQMHMCTTVRIFRSRVLNINNAMSGIKIVWRVIQVLWNSTIRVCATPKRTVRIARHRHGSVWPRPHELAEHSIMRAASIRDPRNKYSSVLDPFLSL